MWNQYILHTYYIVGIVPGTGDIVIMSLWGSSLQCILPLLHGRPVLFGKQGIPSHHHNLLFNFQLVFSVFLEALVWDTVLVIFPVAVIQQSGKGNLTDKRFVLDHSLWLEYTIAEELGLSELEASHGVQNPHPVNGISQLGFFTSVNLIKKVPHK